MVTLQVKSSFHLVYALMINTRILIGIIMKRVANKTQTTEMCSYGCGEIAKFINGSNRLMCKPSSNSCPAVRAKNSTKLKQMYNEGVLSKTKYHTLPQDKKDRMAWNRNKFTNTIFSYGISSGNYKKFLIVERGHICEQCKLSEWLGNAITLELEHIDGDRLNNIKTNLKLLCPNCHSYTLTWKGKNINKRDVKHITDEEFIKALNDTKNVRQALLLLGLTPKAANYERAYSLRNGDVVK